ncbi:hypothetical protein V1289_002037 [Bradyrhizobium sp. AZCC 2289]
MRSDVPGLPGRDRSQRDHPCRWLSGCQRRGEIVSAEVDESEFQNAKKSKKPPRNFFVRQIQQIEIWTKFFRKIKAMG